MLTTRFTKGHGTGNDFVILDDPDGLDLTEQLVRWLCDRRFGIGGDGLLRAVRAGDVPEWTGDPNLWFMDYRNADGSIAQMCGNGLRVFARYLTTRGLLEGAEADIATRAGVKHVRLLDDGLVRADLGPVRVLDDAVDISCGGRVRAARPADVGNPHAVVLLDPDEHVADLDLAVAPTWQPRGVFPEGVNVEFVEPLDGDRVRMRVHERGVGETLSCGTGTAAVAAVMAATTGRLGPWTVEVPGGTITVDLDGGAALIGPAVLVATGEVTLPDSLDLAR